MAVSYKMRKKEKCVRSNVKLNTFFLESLTLRNWGYSRCLKKHSEKKEDKNKLNNKMISKLFTTLSVPTAEKIKPTPSLNPNTNIALLKKAKD